MESLGVGALRALAALARLGTMTSAAQELGCTTGAVSQQLARAESAVGMPLLAKDGRGVRLTDLGCVLARHGEAVVHAEGAALAAVRAARADHEGRLTVGLLRAATTILPPLIRLLAETQPRISIVGHEIDSDDYTSAIFSDGTDVVIGLDYHEFPLPRHPEVEFVELRAERFCLAVPNELASESPIPLSRAARWPWILGPEAAPIGRATRNACRRAGFEPEVVHELTEPAACLALVQAGQGVTPVISPSCAPWAAPCPVVELVEDLQRHLVLIRRCADRDRSTIRSVIAAVRDANLRP